MTWLLSPRKILHFQSAIYILPRCNSGVFFWNNFGSFSYLTLSYILFMKKILSILGLAIVLLGGIAFFVLNGNTTGFKGKSKYVYIPSSITGQEELIRILTADSIVTKPKVFSTLSTYLGYTSQITPGKYKVESGTGTLSLIRLLKSGRQTPVTLTINRVRTVGQLCRMVDNKFEIDSLQFFQYLSTDNNLQQWGVKKEEILHLVVPDTYEFYWTATPEKIMEKMLKNHHKFWNQERLEKAKALQLRPEEVTTLASIVEEETNYNPEKPMVARVYLNRLQMGMPLQADPTVKFAWQDFSLRRIYKKHLTIESPYNTYRVKGLPPGPICVPMPASIEAVLNPAESKNLYFVAHPDMNGQHLFAETYAAHLENAKKYQQALNDRQIK